MRAFLETFKPVRGYEGLYEVSDFGDVRSLRHGKFKEIKKKFYKGYRYKTVVLSNDGKKTYRVHRLVWEAFHGPIPDGYEIDHIDGNKLNNCLSNLRCVTHKENQRNPVTRVRHLEAIKKTTSSEQWRNNMREGVMRACSKPVLQLDKKTGEVIREWESVTDASLKLGITKSNISACCRGKQKSAGGFRWLFK